LYWITQACRDALDAEQTNAYRVGTCESGWIERFGDDFLISAVSDMAGERMRQEFDGFCRRHAVRARRLFLRRLVKQPGEADVPILLSGQSDLPRTVPITERGLRAMVDFEAGYSVGWFCDQRNNRAWMESHARPKTVLNCFAYTGAFSLAAARVGAITTSIDIAKKSLQRARTNFEINGWDATVHRFLVDDVFAVLPRLARRRELYDVIILDPPTFSRGAGGRVFRVEKNLGDLLALVMPLLNSRGWILLSTNARSLDVDALRVIAQTESPAADLKPLNPPEEYPYGSASSTLWFQPNTF